jgi:riboflavin kinase/FMN adenylyltransferase
MNAGQSLTGIVVAGNRNGRALGFPTANLDPSGSLPAGLSRGVYAVLIRVGEKWYKGMANIGTRPTFRLQELTVEAHLFDFSGNLYGEEITIQFLEKIREEKKFSGIDELKTQLEKDRVEILALFAGRGDPDPQAD